MAYSKALVPSIAHRSLNRSLPAFISPSLSLPFLSTSSSIPLSYPRRVAVSLSLMSSISFLKTRDVSMAAEYKFPDPIPEFATTETEKFRNNLINKLSKKDIFGDSLTEVVEVCTEIFSTFLHTEYGGPGTLLVIPFIDMADTLKERELPGGPQAARAAVVWAQKHLDKNWKKWTDAEEDEY